MQQRRFYVNGIERNLILDGETPLSTVIREQLHLTGTKVGCGLGHCGACNVILDGKLVRSCVLKMSRVLDGARILTIEGIGTRERLHPLQTAWIYHGAAQCGFCSPGFIVSAYALLQKNPSPSREEVRDWFQINRNACRCTGYIPLVDAVMDAARILRGEIQQEDLVRKAPEKGSIWGTRYPRPTALAKVTGTLDYGADLGLKMPPETLQLALVQARVSHANIRGIDTSEAEAMPGVFKVVTHKDVKGKNRITGLITFPTNKGDGWDRPILCDQKVFQYGDAIAIVCADTACHAKAAAEKVKVDLEVLPAYMSAPEAMADDAIEIHPGTPNVYFTQHIRKGEETGPLFAQSDVVSVEDDFYLQRQPHMPIEPDVGFAYVTNEGVLKIHSKSIGVHRARETRAGRQPHGRHVRLQVQSDDGGFGRRSRPRHGPARLPEVRLSAAAAVHRQALAVLHPHEAGGEEGRDARRDGDRLHRGPRTLLRVRGPADPAGGPVHGGGVPHP